MLAAAGHWCEHESVFRLACTAVAVGVLASAAVAARASRSFEGVGRRTLAPFSLAHGATLRWQATGGLLGGLFALRMLNARADVANPQLAFSRARSGSVHLAPGRYVLRIETLPGTRWQITIG
jgi:hypothetical protein